MSLFNLIEELNNLLSISVVINMFECLPIIRPLASIGGCQLIKMVRGRPSRLITVKSLGAELGAVNSWINRKKEGKNDFPLPLADESYSHISAFLAM